MTTVISVPVFIFAHIANDARKAARTSRSMAEQDVRVGCLTSSGQTGTKVAVPAKAVLHVPTQLHSSSIPVFGRLALKPTKLPPRYIQEVVTSENTEAPLVQRGLTAGTLTKTPQLAGRARLRLQE